MKLARCTPVAAGESTRRENATRGSRTISQVLVAVVGFYGGGGVSFYRRVYLFYHFIVV